MPNISIPCKCGTDNNFKVKISNPGDTASILYIEPDEEKQTKVCEGCGRKIILRGVSILLLLTK